MNFFPFKLNISRRSVDNVYGVKGIGEMTANVPSPAIVNAIHDAIGVWFNEIPVTAERVLRALEMKGGR
jgi:CO/xanthine dehydrogenase Mo-binding subunit